VELPQIQDTPSQIKSGLDMAPETPTDKGAKPANTPKSG
jgi:hypothetical protein